jgi:hypothetical protein
MLYPEEPPTLAEAIREEAPTSCMAEHAARIARPDCPRCGGEGITEYACGPTDRFGVYQDYCEAPCHECEEAADLPPNHH